MKDIRLLTPHYAKCAYVLYRSENQGSPWYFRPASVFRQNYREFAVLICNDPDCGAELRVALNYFEDVVPSFIREDAEMVGAP